VFVARFLLVAHLFTLEHIHFINFFLCQQAVP
jgi:hypothetical protein